MCEITHYFGIMSEKQKKTKRETVEKKINLEKKQQFIQFLVVNIVIRDKILEKKEKRRKTNETLFLR